MSRLRFGMDIDGVIYNWDDTARFLLNYQFGYKLPPATHWNEYEDAVTTEHWKWLWSVGVERGLFRYGHIYKGSAEVIRELAELVDIVFITSRVREGVKDTVAWLAFYQFSFKELHFVGSAPKSSVPCDIYLDDAQHNLKELLLNTNAHVIGFKRAWNIPNDLPEALWIENWAEVIDLVKRILLYEKRGGKSGV